MGNREVVTYHPERVDWVDVGLDVAGIVTLGVGRWARSAATLAKAKKAGDVISGIQVLKSEVGVATATPKDRVPSIIQLGTNVVVSLYPSPWVQWPLAFASLRVDLNNLTETTYEPIYE